MRNSTPSLAQVARQDVGGKAGLLLVEVDRDEGEGNRRPALQREQDVEQAVAVLAAGQADHHAVAGLDHRVVADGLADLALQALGELVGLELRAPRIARGARRRRSRRRGRAAASHVVHGRADSSRWRGYQIRSSTVLMPTAAARK